MKTMIYSFHGYEESYFEKVQHGNQQLVFTDKKLSADTVSLSAGCRAVSLFANDDASGAVLELLHKNGVRFIALRSAGYDHVDMQKARQLGIRVARVPAYSPFAVAEHAVALMLALNRKLILSNARIRSCNFSLNGLTGFDMHGKTVGIVGTGKIGTVVARILHGFGCSILACDKVENEELKQNYRVQYTDFDSLCRLSDIITLHVPLSEQTQHMIDRSHIASFRQGTMLINTSRGALVDTSEVILALKSGGIGYFGMDVYEKEKELFFEDHSQEILRDDVLARLMTFPNVLITGHQGFLTDTALKNICEATLQNLECFEREQACPNEI